MDIDKMNNNIQQNAKSSAKTGVKRGAFSDEADLNKIIRLSKELDLPIINLAKYKITEETLRLIPEEVAVTYNVIPLALFSSTVTVAVNDPFDIVVLDALRALTKLDIQMVLGSALQITEAINDYYGAVNQEKTFLAQEAFLEKTFTKKEAFLSAENTDVHDIKESSHNVKTVGIVNDILTWALKQRASDIHMEPYPEELRIRYRIDGLLQERKMEIDPKFRAAIIARLKIMARLDITQRRLPQDGRISLKLESKEVDLRVSILPLVSGEKVVMRILEKSNLNVNLEKLGFSPDVFEIFKNVTAKPHGMILITGPTGSGKSTTLYAILNRLNTSEKHLVTVEDPVEYQLRGITQIQVRQEINLNFAQVLRSVLRQSPDIVMVGEIRDFETVDIAIKAALTGHLILSTLHTNDSVSTIVRLMNMKVEPFLIASTVVLIAAQRLCRKICQHCKEAYEVPVTHLVGFPKGFKESKAILYRGKGCPQCNNKGYYGRVAVVEAFLIDDVVRQMILERAPLGKIQDYARSHGMKSLREDAMEKCLKGEIPLEEVLRVTPEDRVLTDNEGI